MAVLKIARFWQTSKHRGKQVGLVAAGDSLGLDVFGSEIASAPLAAPPAPSESMWMPAGARGVSRRAWFAAVAIVITGAALGFGGYEYRRHPLPWLATTGSVAFETVPSGLEIFVRGTSVGRSPLTVALAPGSYAIRLGSGVQAPTRTVEVTAGKSVIQHYEMVAAPAVAAATVGTVRIQTEPGNLPILFDGVEKGASPLTLENIRPGQHEIVVHAAQGPLQRAVTVVAGETTSVLLSPVTAKAEPGLVAAGWLTVTSVIPLQVREGGRLIGNSDVERLMLASGSHTLDLSNDSFGYHLQRRVTIAPGKTIVSRVDVPNGTLSVNALPWADVYLDGKSLGQTPIGNVTLPIGVHEVVFRHPDLGDRKETVNVTTLSPARLGVDLRKRQN